MVCKKIKNSSGTLTGVIISLLLVMGTFFVGFSYMKTQANAGDITVPQKYNDTFTNLETSQGQIDTNVHKIQTNVENITEAESAYQVAWNGLKGLGNTIKLTVNFASAMVDTTSAMLIPLDVIPNKVKSLILIGATVFIIFLVVSLLKGDPKLS